MVQILEEFYAKPFSHREKGGAPEPLFWVDFRGLQALERTGKAARDPLQPIQEVACPLAQFSFASFFTGFGACNRFNHLDLLAKLLPQFLQLC